MKLMTSENALMLWQDAVKEAKNRCSVELKGELETYLVCLLDRYTNQPDVAKQVLATAFLEASQAPEPVRQVSLQEVGDQCLLYAGLFPKTAQKRLVKISYFVDIGQTAYTTISSHTNDIFNLLAFKFVVLMDVLQSIRNEPDLMPIDAYEQWQEVGSQRALRILKTYTKNIS